MKKSFGDKQREIQGAFAGQEAMFGDLRIGKGARQLGVQEIAPKREIKNHSPAHDMEAAVMLDIAEVLVAHPKVAWALKVNSGETEYGDRADPRRVQYYRWLKKPRADDGSIIQEVTVPDVLGQLTDGRLFLIEGKRRAWKMIPSDYRAKRQGNLLAECRRRGSVSGFATCAEEALAILDAA